MAQSDFVHHFELLTHFALSCIDGRADRPVVGAPGGSIGELAIVLAASEMLGTPHWDQDRLDSLITDLLQRVGPLYIHTDNAAVLKLSRAAGYNGDDSQFALEAILNPPAGRVAAVLEASTNPDNVGCGHLQRLLLGKTEGPRPTLVAALIRAVIAHAQRGEAGIGLEVLEGHHEEAEVAVFPSCTSTGHGRATLVSPKTDTDARFVYHPDAARWVRQQLCQFLETRGDVDNAQQLLAEADDLAEQELNNTLAALAPDLPVRVVEPDCPR